MAITTTLTGDGFSLRPLQPQDTDILRRIFSDPDVAQWWGDPDKSVSDAMDLSADESGFVIEVGDDAAGYIQCFEEPDGMYRYAAIDIALRSDWQGKGYGPDAIKTLARHLIEQRGHHRLTIDPAAHNTRAIRAYRKCGFKTVGIMRSYEKGPSGDWHDGLLMDLLAEDIEL
ncbi:MAG TPA: GNAT family protein [Candidatus Dormibacteraeota bacterium]